MNFVEWSKSNIGYGRKLVNSALDGARAGEGEFLKQESLAAHLGESTCKALGPALVGACLGVAGASLSNGRRSYRRAVAYGLVGGAIGLGAGLMWDNGPLAERVFAGAWKRISKTRDEHWFEKNPIDYA